MFQYIVSVLPSSIPKLSSEISDIERFRARQRCLCRGQTAAQARSKMEELNIDNGRTRKVSAKWQQQQTQRYSHYDEGIWPKSAGTEMHLGYNAFDFSASPEAFYTDLDEPITSNYSATQARQQGSKELYEPALQAETERSALSSGSGISTTNQATSMNFNVASKWEQKFTGWGPIQ